MLKFEYTLYTILYKIVHLIMFDQLPDEIILHIINVSKNASTASRLILVNKHLTELALERIIKMRNNHPAWKILRTAINKDNELVIDDIFTHYEPFNKLNPILHREALAAVLASCFLKNTSFKDNNIEIYHSHNIVSLYDNNDSKRYIWGTHARRLEHNCYYNYFEYTNEWEIFNYIDKHMITSREDGEPLFTFSVHKCRNVCNIFLPTFPGVGLQFWFPIRGNKKDEFYKFLRANRLPYPHPDIVVGPSVGGYRKLYYTL
jgi:hypothetical protein